MAERMKLYEMLRRSKNDFKTAKILEDLNHNKIKQEFITTIMNVFKDSDDNTKKEMLNILAYIKVPAVLFLFDHIMKVEKYEIAVQAMLEYTNLYIRLSKKDRILVSYSGFSKRYNLLLNARNTYIKLKLKYLDMMDELYNTIVNASISTNLKRECLNDFARGYIILSDTPDLLEKYDIKKIKEVIETHKLDEFRYLFD